MAAANTIIIIRKKKGGHHEEHGNTAWKIAYADFVTAMMAFFLLLWLLNSVTEEQMVGLTNYFAPTSVSYTNSGSGGVLGSTDVMKDGAMKDSQAAVGIQQGAMSNTEEEMEDPSAEDSGLPFSATGSAEGGAASDAYAALAAAEAAPPTRHDCRASSSSWSTPSSHRRNSRTWPSTWSWT